MDPRLRGSPNTDKANSMNDRAGGNISTQSAVGAINAIVQAIDAEIAARNNATHETATKRNRRFANAKSAHLSELANMASSTARQLNTAKTRAIAEIAKAEAAGFIVHEDLTVTDPATASSPARTDQADAHAAAIQTAATRLRTLDEQVASRLIAAANRLDDISDN